MPRRVLFIGDLEVDVSAQQVIHQRLRLLEARLQVPLPPMLLKLAQTVLILNQDH